MDARFVEAAERALGARLTDAGGIERGKVARMLVDGGPGTVIVKAASKDPPGEQFWNEYAGLRFLTDLPDGPPGTPRLLAADLDAGVVVMEDLGDDPSLARLLLGEDPGRAEAALFGWVEAMARVHLATVGRAAAFRAIREPMGPAVDAQVDLGSVWRSFSSAIDVSSDVDPPDALTEVARRIRAEPSPFLAFRLNDACPDNNRVAADGTVRFFDMEWCGISHALLDIAYVQTTMPTCWCVRRLPDQLQGRLVERYRAAIADDIPEAGTRQFDDDLAAARVRWAIWRLPGLLKYAEGPDDPAKAYWDIYDFTMLGPRQQILFRLGQLEAVGTEVAWVAPLGEWAAAAAARLRSRWGDIPDVPLYPALGGPPPSVSPTG